MPAMEKQAFGGIVIVHIVFWKYRCKNCVKACVYMNGCSVMIAEIRSSLGVFSFIVV